MKLQAEQVQKFFDDIRTDLDDKYVAVNTLGETISKLQGEVDTIIDDLKVIEERRVAEEESKAKEIEEIKEN